MVLVHVELWQKENRIEFSQNPEDVRTLIFTVQAEQGFSNFMQWHTSGAVKGLQECCENYPN